MDFIHNTFRMQQENLIFTILAYLYPFELPYLFLGLSFLNSYNICIYESTGTNHEWISKRLNKNLEYHL